MAQSDENFADDSMDHDAGDAIADDVIRWATESLLLQGAAGLSTEWEDEYLNTLITWDIDDSVCQGSIDAPGPDLMDALNSTVRSAEREDWLDEALRANNHMFNDADAILTDRLGPDRAKGLDIRSKLVVLINDGLPVKVKPAHFVARLVVENPSGKGFDEHVVRIGFTDSLFRFLGILGDCTAYAASMSGHDGGYTLSDGPWLYQLLDHTGKPGTAAIRIRGEVSYAAMVRRLRDPKWSSVALIHVGLPMLAREFGADCLRMSHTIARSILTAPRSRSQCSTCVSQRSFRSRTRREAWPG